jgi:hypothetical protein
VQSPTYCRLHFLATYSNTSFAFMQTRPQSQTIRAVTGESVVSMMLFVCVIQGSSSCPSDGSNAGTFSPSGQGADCCSTRRPDADSLSGIDVALVPDPAPITAVMARSSDRGRRCTKEKS